MNKKETTSDVIHVTCLKKLNGNSNQQLSCFPSAIPILKVMKKDNNISFICVLLDTCLPTSAIPGL